MQMSAHENSLHGIMWTWKQVVWCSSFAFMIIEEIFNQKINLLPFTKRLLIKTPAGVPRMFRSHPLCSARLDMVQFWSHKKRDRKQCVHGQENWVQRKSTNHIMRHVAHGAAFYERNKHWSRVVNVLFFHLILKLANDQRCSLTRAFHKSPDSCLLSSQNRKFTTAKSHMLYPEKRKSMRW